MDRAAHALVLLRNRRVLRERLRMHLGLPVQLHRRGFARRRLILGENFRNDDPLRRVVIMRRLVLRERLREAILVNLDEGAERRWGLRPLFSMRPQWGAWFTLIPFLRANDPEKFRNYLRMTPRLFDELVARMRPHLERRHLPNCVQVGPGERLALTLRYLAIGDYQVSISYAFYISTSSVSAIIRDTCVALWEVLSEEVFPAPTVETFLRIAEEFEEQWDFPNCIGAIDGKHCAIQNFAHMGTEFYNYKNFFSVVLLAMCDANYKFIFADIGGRGRRSDGGLFTHSALGVQFHSGEIEYPEPRTPDGWVQPLPYCIIGDEAFPLDAHLMTPRGGRFLPDEWNIYNYRLSRARRVIENAFGIMSARWRILRRTLLASEETVRGIISACVVLHNLFVMNDENLLDAERYVPDGFVDREVGGRHVPGRWRLDVDPDEDLLLRPLGDVGVDQDRGERFTDDQIYAVRRQFRDYFLSPAGRVQWQWRHMIH